MGKQILRILTVVLILVAVHATANADVYILTEGTGYTANECFHTGRNKPIPSEKIQQGWNNGKHIIAAAYTDISGWVISMAANTGFRRQKYTSAPQWPQQWIEEQWYEGYQITQVAYGMDEWFIVMTKQCGLSNQQVATLPDWDNTSNYIRKWWAENHRITSICCNGNLWTVVMSKVPEVSVQRYDFHHTWAKISTKVKGNWDLGFYISSLTWGVREVCAIFSKAPDRPGLRQVAVEDREDIDTYLRQGYAVTVIGNHM